MPDTSRRSVALSAWPCSAASVEDLTRWEEHGAVWRAVEVSDERAVVELCSCYGELVDMVRSEAPELIAFVRARRDGST